MLVVVAILVLITVLVFVSRQSGQQTPESTPDSTNSANPAKTETAPWSAPGADGWHVVFLSDGKLFERSAKGIQQIQSPFIQDFIDQQERRRNMHGWKENTAFGVSTTGQRREFTKDNVPIFATSAQFLPDNTLLYILRDEVVGGLFSYDFSTGEEKRLLHRQNLLLSDLCLEPTRMQLLCSSRARNGTANIVMMTAGGDQYRELTGGDAFDSAPCWIPGEDKKILYQSAGLARNEAGYVVAQGHSTIQLLDMKSGDITAIKDDPNFDFLYPRVDARGTMYFIRRPHERPKYQAENFLLDTLFFPFRLLRAVFHYLNFFSLMYTRKPLTSASGPAVQADIKEIILKGKRIDAERALREEASVQGVPSLVPKTWQLISRTAQGQETVLASNVAAYDLTPEGEIVYSNGRGVFLLEGGGKTSLLLKSDLIDDVFVKRLG